MVWCAACCVGCCVVLEEWLQEWRRMKFRIWKWGKLLKMFNFLQHLHPIPNADLEWIEEWRTRLSHHDELPLSPLRMR